MICQDNNNNKISKISKQINSKEIGIHAKHFRRVMLPKLCLVKTVTLCSEPAVYGLYPRRPGKRKPAEAEHRQDRYSGGDK